VSLSRVPDRNSVLRRPACKTIRKSPISQRVLSNGLIDKIPLSDDSLMAIVNGFDTVLVLRTAWRQAPDNLVRASWSCPETHPGLNDLTGTEFML
jgi:hypothetical protein